MRLPPFGHRKRAILAAGLAIAIQLASAVAVAAASGGSDWLRVAILN
jgi:hypothetical protein